MKEEYFIFIFFPVVILCFAHFYYHYLKLRKLLRKYNKPTSWILWGFSLFRDISEAKKLINELGDSTEAKAVKTALRRTDIAFIIMPAAFFALGILLFSLFSLNPDVKFF